MLKNYIKIALKVLLRRKFFTFISLFGISFTLLVLVVVTSFVDNTFGPHTPEKKLDRTLSSMFFQLSGESGNSQGAIISYYVLNKYVKSLKTPEKVSISSIYNSFVTYKNNKKLDLTIKFTDSEFWEILDFDFIEGKPFNKNDVSSGNFVAVINEETRRQYFGGEPAVGKMIEAEDKNYRVIGVVKNVSILRILPYSDVWVPVTTSNDDLNRITLMGTLPGYGAMILARDRSDFQAIKDEFQKHMNMVEFPDDEFNAITGSADTYEETISRIMFMDFENTHTRAMLLVLFLLMVLFMLLPTINLVNINVSRIVERASEIGVRKSFGASSMTLVGQFVVENIILTLIGGLLSLVLAVIVLNIINDSGFIPHVQLGLNFRIFAVSLFIILFFGLFSGVYPAFKMSRMKPVEALKGGQV